MGLHDVLTRALQVFQPRTAVAEAFGRIPVWTTDTFVHGSGRPQQLLTYELPDTARLFDLNDVVALAALGINRPTGVVTRNRARTQAWARAIFERGGHAGARWWSCDEPEWTVAELWDRGGTDCPADRSLVRRAEVA